MPTVSAVQLHLGEDGPIKWLFEDVSTWSMAEEAARYFQSKNMEVADNLTKWLRMECSLMFPAGAPEDSEDAWRLVSRPLVLDSEDALDRIVFFEGPGLVHLHVYARVSFRADGTSAKGLQFHYEGETRDLSGS